RGRECRRVPRLGRQQLRYRDRTVRRRRPGPGLGNGWEQHDRHFPFEPDDQGRCDEWYARVALVTNARVRAVHARKLLGWAPYDPDLTTVLKGDLSHGKLQMRS